MSVLKGVGFSVLTDGEGEVRCSLLVGAKRLPFGARFGILSFAITDNKPMK